jgi:hypothetical protein
MSDLLIYLLVLLGPRWFYSDRHPSTHDLPHAVSTSFHPKYVGYLTHDVQGKCGREAQWWDSGVVGWSRRWSSRGKLILPLSEEGLSFVVEGAFYGGVEFVEDASLKDHAIVDFYVEYDDWLFGRSKFCTLKDIAGTGIGIFVSDIRLSHGTQQRSYLISGPEVCSQAKANSS